MSLLSLVIIIAVVGVLVYIITLLPIPQLFRNIIYAVTALFLILWVLQALGIDTGLPRLRLK